MVFGVFTVHCVSPAHKQVTNRDHAYLLPHASSTNSIFLFLADHSLFEHSISKSDVPVQNGPIFVFTDLVLLIKEVKTKKEKIAFSQI